MTLPSIVPTGFAGDATDFLKVKRDTFGALRNERGAVTVPSGTTANSYIGLVPVQEGATLKIDNASVHCGDFGAGTTTVNLGLIYEDDTSFTNDPDAWVSASTAAQSGGFLTVDEIEGLTLVAEGSAWLVVQILAADADSEADITFSVGVVYDK